MAANLSCCVGTSLAKRKKGSNAGQSSQPTGKNNEGKLTRWALNVLTRSLACLLACVLAEYARNCWLAWLWPAAAPTCYAPSDCFDSHLISPSYLLLRWRFLFFFLFADFSPSPDKRFISCVCVSRPRACLMSMAPKRGGLPRASDWAIPGTRPQRTTTQVSSVLCSAAAAGAFGNKINHR